MQIYLPIAEMAVNLFWVLGLGWVIGFLSGLFGVGGGFLMTPTLILMGIPPAVSVGSPVSSVAVSPSASHAEPSCLFTGPVKG